jgi:hypothetical protein
MSKKPSGSMAPGPHGGEKGWQDATVESLKKCPRMEASGKKRRQMRSQAGDAGHHSEVVLKTSTGSETPLKS